MPRQTGQPAARWGQLTYSSFDRQDGTGGGWQVKDITGGLDRDEEELLRARVRTQFDAGVDLPRFPTPAELDELPRRLVYAPAGSHGSETALWHHVPAGHDASGRPGNVFAHVVLDRNPDAYDTTRPIERWRSPDWLAPFGPEAVLAAVLTATDPPRPGPLSRQMIGSWLFAPRQWRMQTLGVLLDAIRAAFGGGPLVVLGAEDVDEAAHWIAAVSCAMSAGTARRFFWSTLERPAGLAEAAERGLHLVCVPRPDLRTLQRRADVVVVDPAGPLELGDLDGEPHRTPRGDRVTVGEWSVLVQEIFTDPSALSRGVGEFDRIAHSVGDSGLDPAWPAAMAVAQRPHAESRREAARVLAECAPPQLRSVPELYATAVTGLRREVAGRADLAWRHVTKLGADAEESPPTVAGEVAVGVYAELALADPTWLAERGPARLPSTHYYSPTPEPDLARLAESLGRRIRPRADLPPPEVGAEARAGLHLVELALRLGLAHDETVARGLWGVCQQTIIPVLTHREQGPELATSIDATVARETRHWLWRQLSTTTLPGDIPGERLGGAVLAMLGPGADDPDPLAATWAWLSDHPDPDEATISPLLGELAWQRIRDGDLGPDPRFVAAWSHLAAFEHTRDPELLRQAGTLFVPPWDLERLLQLILRWRTSASSDWFLRGLAEAPLDDASAGLLGGDLAARDDLVGRFARVRAALAPSDWLSATRGPGSAVDPDGLTAALTALADGLGLARHQRAEPHPELLRRANALVVLGLLAARSRVVPEAVALERAAGLAQAAVSVLPGAEAAFTTAEATELVAWCDEAAISSTVLTELFLLADPRSMLRAADDRVAGWLHAVGTGEPDSAPVTAKVLAARLCRNAEGRARATEQIMAALRSTPGSSDERATRQTERFLSGWLRQAQTGRVRR